MPIGRYVRVIATRAPANRLGRVEYWERAVTRSSWSMGSRFMFCAYLEGNRLVSGRLSRNQVLLTSTLNVAKRELGLVVVRIRIYKIKW